MRRLAAFSLVLGLAAASGCDSGNGAGASCGVAPCGGDITGSWNLAAACADTESLRQMLRDAFLQGSMGACAQADAGPVSIGLSGPLTYSADLTYEVTTSVTIDASLLIPLSCIPGTTCAALGDALKQQSSQITGCTGSSTCTCAMHIVEAGTPETGTYTVSGTVIDMVASDGTTSEASFCVKGNTVTLHNSAPAAGSEWLQGLVAERK